MTFVVVAADYCSSLTSHFGEFIRKDELTSFYSAIDSLW